MTSRCTRQLAMLRKGGGEGGAVFAEPDGLRKEMLLAKLETLTRVMAVQVVAFALMDNHVHKLLRVDHELAASWSDEEVLRRWWALHPLRNGYNQPREAKEEEVAEKLADEEFLSDIRAKLVCLSHFVKCFKQHAAEQINKLEKTSGPVWAGRFHSVLVEDPAQLVATMIYVDLNPFAAGECDTPEGGRFTSLAGRLARDVPAGDGAVASGRTPPTRSSRRPRAPRAPRRQSAGVWLRPLDESREPRKRNDRRGGRLGAASTSAGTVAKGLSLRVYLRLLDAVARKIRGGKHRLHASTRGIFDRIGLDAEEVAERVAGLIAMAGAAPPAGSGEPRSG
ncbi:hypothetical protein [Phycisphaera mikurensis]|uniref:hypothetical protein n=1 Tax=Phycisphaera mikurensis TaxID=547188 RepID=UPI00059D0B8A|nr:hypothetical protein [Phycisphaera mikurensis]MBB6442611.1 REP element-mobilizing transposase RayT [Phycisphaera mikurensis]